MAHFNKALWDGSDPLYAPCLSKSGRYLYWKAPKKYADLGCDPKRERLAGTSGDGDDPARALRCRELTASMIDQFAEEQPTVQIGTWEWMFMRYQTDAESPYQDVKANTREIYDILINKWIEAIGDTLLSGANFQAVKRWEHAMKDNGRSADWIARMFTMMRTVVGYGAALENAECQRFQVVLSNMRFKKGKPKNTAGTPDQIAKIVDVAMQDGAHAFVLGCSLQWWFSMRAVDVRGQWLDMNPGEAPSGIVRNGKRWQDGLTWDMINRDVTQIVKTFSKTEGTTGASRLFDLTQTPEIREQLMATPPDKRVGPVIVSSRSGMPYTRHGWCQAWARYRKSAGVPDHVKNMGIRPAALTHGERAGASPFELRDAAGHADISTTNRYIREADEAAAKVVKLRRNQA